jgi:hypothetical protein
LVFEGLVERENDYALIISLDSVNSSAFVEAYTPIQSPDSSTLSHIYLSACDFPDTELSTFCNTTNIYSNSAFCAAKHLAPYTDLFLSTKKKYKPVDNLNTTQTLEYSKGKYHAKIRKQSLS